VNSRVLPVCRSPFSIRVWYFSPQFASPCTAAWRNNYTGVVVACQKNGLPVSATVIIIIIIIMVGVGHYVRRLQHARHSGSRRRGISDLSTFSFSPEWLRPSSSHLQPTSWRVWIRSVGGGLPLISWHSDIHPSSVAAAADWLGRYLASGDDNPSFLWRYDRPAWHTEVCGVA